MKRKEILKMGITELNKQKIEEATLKAQMLIEHELEVSHEKFVMNCEDEMSGESAERFFAGIDMLIKGKPIQYIVNNQNFYGLDFYVDENVLIPQPDTEILVEEVIQIAKKIDKKAKVLDICTGSGAIAIAICKNQSVEMVASDVSQKALEIAKKNALNNSVEMEFIQSNMFENISEKFDIIVSNPPYIETETIKDLSEEVKNEPILALDGGKDGLDFYRILAEQAGNYLKKDGILAVEIGYNQKKKVMELLEKSGFYDVYSKKDLGNQDRIVVGKWV